MHTETVLESNDIETVVAARAGDTLGYARVSTNDQNLDAQCARLTEAGAIRVFTDIVSGKRFDRPGLAELMNDAQAVTGSGVIDAGPDPAPARLAVGMGTYRVDRRLRLELRGRGARQRPSVEPLSHETPRLALDAASDLRVILRTNLAMTPSSGAHWGCSSAKACRVVMGSCRGSPSRRGGRRRGLGTVRTVPCGPGGVISISTIASSMAAPSRFS